MAQSARNLMRAGLISPKASAKLAVLRGTRAQRSKDASFEQSFRDEGKVQQTGHTDHRGGHINEASSQKAKGAVARQADMPTRNMGRATGFAASKRFLRGSKTKEGGGAQKAGGKYVPGRNQIDEFPQKQSRMRDRTSTFAASPTGAGAFPSGANISGSGSKPVNPGSRGGKQNYRGNFYGAPNARP